MKNFFRVAPGLSIIAVFLAVFWSPFYEMLPPDFQVNMDKLFLAVLGVVIAHWLGKALFPRVVDWGDDNQAHIKFARIALYVALPIAIALGG